MGDEYSLQASIALAPRREPKPWFSHTSSRARKDPCVPAHRMSGRPPAAGKLSGSQATARANGRPFWPGPVVHQAAVTCYVLELLDARAIEFLTASHAELIQKINRAGFCHVPKLDEAFVRLQIGIQDFLGDLVRGFHHFIG
jgi:hypothetical protein